MNLDPTAGRGQGTQTPKGRGFVVLLAMDRREVLEILRAHADDIRRKGVIALYLYGSYARDQGTESSDVDLYAEVDYSRFGFVPFMDLREDLARWLGRRVDFTTHNGLHSDLR